MSTNIVPIKDNTPVSSALEFCQRAVEKNRDGKMSAFVGVLFMKGGNYRVFSTRTVSHHEMVGILTDAIHDACENFVDGEAS